ncbi:hypothetical protein SBY92_001115 [Candida maltosa Xu316]
MESSPSQRQAFMNNVRPKTPKSQSESSIYPPSGSHRSTSSLPIEYDDVEDDNQLEETITPAQLNYLQTQNHYMPYQPEPRAPYQPRQYYPISSPQRPKNKNNDYYIRQKKRIDKAQIVKPKMYSHKTFRDVFEDKSEKLDRYNPMDLVFEKKDPNGKSNFLDKVQTKLTKEKYDDYNYYDHRPKKSPPKPEVFVDDAESDDDYIESQPEEVEVEQVVTVGEGKNKETKVIKKKVPLKKVMQMKLNQAKKELGRDFVAYSHRQREINDQIKESKKDIRKRKEMERAAAKEKEKEKSKKDKKEPNAEKPEDSKKEDKKGEDAKDKEEKSSDPVNDAGWWGYMTSWIAYPEEKPNEEKDEKASEEKGEKASEEKGEKASEEKGDKATDEKEAKKESTESVKGDSNSVKSVPYPLTPFEKNTKKLKIFSKNSQKIFNNWNQPATKLFNRDLLESPTVPVAASSNKSSRTVKSYKSHTTANPSVRSVTTGVETIGESKEFVIECSDSEAEAEEMFFNPATNQLEPAPPTSASSMLTTNTNGETSSQAETSGNPFQFNFDPNAPIVVVSTWINLIKRIQIMKMLFAPIDIIGEFMPGLQGVVVFIELVLFVWILYELSRLVDAICMMIKAVCAPMIAVGRFMNRVV